MTEIPFLDVRASYLELKSVIDEAVAGIMDGGWYIGGEACTGFERQFAAYVGARYCVGVGNGLDALHLALRAMEVGTGDEVIVPSNTYIATWLAVTHAGATPVPVEPIEGTYNLDPARIEYAVTSRTKAIIPVHLYGQPADMGPIIDVAKKHDLLVLEDAAQAHGARYRGDRIGGHGDAVAWSFYPGKNLGAFGDAGAITTNDDVIADRVRTLGNYGSRTKYHNDLLGFNSRLDPLQAALLQVKLEHLDEWNARRQRIASLYLGGLRDLPLSLPAVPPWADAVWHLFVVRSALRDDLVKFLRGNGVGIVVHYPVAPHLQAAYSHLGLTRGSLPVAERIHDEVLSLPIGPHLSTEQARRVVELVRRFFE